jgi:hypothetical protein
VLDLHRFGPCGCVLLPVLDSLNEGGAGEQEAPPIWVA